MIPAGNENAEELSEISKAAKEINEYLSKYEFKCSFNFNEFSTFRNQYLQTEEPLKKPSKTIQKKANSLFVGAQNCSWFSSIM